MEFFTFPGESESVSHSVMSHSLWPCELSPPDSPVHAILQARILEWIAISFSKGSSWPRNQTLISSIAGRFFTVLSHQGSPISNWYRRVALLLLSDLFHGRFAAAAGAKSFQLCPTLCDPIQKEYLSSLRMQKVAYMPVLPTVAFQSL